MRPEALAAMARGGHLYPSVILHGGTERERRDRVLDLAKTLLCEREVDERPCGACRHCHRIAWADGANERFHPDFQVLERDLKTSTSVAATKAFLQVAQVTPFEARGQVFVVADAQSLTGEAANALLKTLEEPHAGSPRNFFLLTPSQFDLLPTIRSRSQAVYLGDPGGPDGERLTELAAAFEASLDEYARGGSTAHLLAAADALSKAGKWDDPRASGPWELAAGAVLAVARRRTAGSADLRPLLALAEDLLRGPNWRLRAVPAPRILEGLVTRHLADGTS